MKGGSETCALPMRVLARLTYDMVDRIAHRVMRCNTLAPASAAQKMSPQRIQRVATRTRRIRDETGMRKAKTETESRHEQWVGGWGWVGGSTLFENWVSVMRKIIGEKENGGE